MKKSKNQKTKVSYQEIRRLVEIGFCYGMRSVKPSVIDAMNKGPCFLGSEKHLGQCALLIYNALLEAEVSK